MHRHWALPQSYLTGTLEHVNRERLNVEASARAQHAAGLFSVQRRQRTQNLMVLLVYLVCELKAAQRYNIGKKNQ